MKVIRRSISQIIGGQAKPGASLASIIKNMNIFCKDFNEKTKDQNGIPLNVKITVYEDKSYSYELLNIPTSFLIKQAMGSEKKIEKEQITKIAQQIIKNLNTEDLEKAEKIVKGVLKSFNNINLN